MSTRGRIGAIAAAGLAVAVAFTLPSGANAAPSSSAPPTVRNAATAVPALPPGASVPVGHWNVSSTATNAPAADGQVAPADVTIPNGVTITPVNIGATTATFSWTPNGDGGSPILDYRVGVMNRNSVSIWEETTPDASTTSVTVSNLDPETRYYFYASAYNSVGESTQVAYPFTTIFDRVERQYGPDRFATAARVAYRAFPYSMVTAAYVANGLNFPDALASAAAVGPLDGPVLLTLPDSLPSATTGELSFTQPTTIYVPGGPSVVSGSVLNSLSAYAATPPAQRQSGPDRYATAAAIAGSAPRSTVYLASGENFPDALAGAAAAAASHSPVLLTRQAVLPAATATALQSMQPSKIVVLGSTGAISDAVVAQAKAATGVTTSVQRLAGTDRYATAVAVSQATFPTPDVPVVYVATGLTFPDALAGAAAAGARGGPVLLTPTSSALASVIAEIKRLNPQRVIVLGSPAVVSNTVMQQIQSALSAP